MKCARTVCPYPATSGPHSDGTGRRYCEMCRKAINEAAGRELIPRPYFPHPNPPALPPYFTLAAQEQADTCPYLLTERGEGTNLKAGDMVYARNLRGIEESFAAGQKIRALVYGFTVPHGYAALLTPEGKWWLIQPEACTLCCPKCGKTSGDDWSQCQGACPMPGSPHYRSPA